jgi:hypothetical protein
MISPVSSRRAAMFESVALKARIGAGRDHTEPTPSFQTIWLHLAFIVP